MRSTVRFGIWRRRQAGRPVWQLAALPEPRPLVTAYTLSLGDPEAMARGRMREPRTGRSSRSSWAATGDRERLAAVRRRLPRTAG